MKNYKKISIIIVIMLVFLIGNKTRVFASLNEEFFESNLNIENLIEYINNLDLTEEEVTNIAEKSKAISKDIKEKATFKDYKLTEIIRIYRNFTSMSKSLKLNIDFSMKNGEFSLKDESNNNSIFKGNISEIKTYFNAIKNNTELLTKEVLPNIDNKELTKVLTTEVFANIDNKYLIEFLEDEILSNIEDKSLVKSIEEVKYEDTSSYENLQNNENLIDNEEVEIIENNDEYNEAIHNSKSNLYSNKLGNNIIVTIALLLLVSFATIILYIKFR